MNKLTLLCLVALALIHNVFAADYCTAKVVQVESAGSWDEAHLHKRVVDLHIVNDHSICSFSESVTLSITPAAGGILGNLWGIGKDNIVSVGDVQPGKVHGGLGLVYSGAGQPTIAVTAFGKCVCGDLGPQNPPTTPPAVTPAPTPAPGPTTPPTEAPEAYYTLGLKFAILTCNASADIRLPVAKNVLGAVGSSYTVFNRVDWGTSPLELENADGSGKFYAMVATVELACWTSDQVAKINAYNIKNHVKMVILYTNAYATNGVSTQGPEALSVTDTTTYVTFASAMLPSVGPLVHDAHIPIFGVYLNKAKIDSPALAKAALNLKFNGQDYIAAAFITYDDGRNHLEFYMDSADWATFPTILGTAWLNWVTNGVFAGSRRIEFNAHMDDIFMMTGTFNPETGGEDESTPMKYRITPEDLQKTLDWQNALNDRLTEGSHVVLTFPYNGATVKEKGGFQTDDLFIKAKALRDDFIWESHTWSHPYLTNLSYDEVTAEYQKNIETLAVLFDVANTHESINKVPNYCSIATITPSITGLFNPDAMQAMYDFGIRFVVGDNSRAELIPYTSLYHVLHSNVSTNGVDGINIVPRHATNIYYDGSLPEHITDQFNFNYAVKLGHDFTFDEIVQRDMQVAVKNLLLFRHDPFMFHQANLRFSTEGYESGEHSLLSYWVDTVLDELEKYISLPVISRKHEDLGQLFLDREDRDNCGFEGTLKFLKADHSVVGIKAKSTGTCSFGISGVETEDKIAHVDSVEYYGEEKTTWLKMEANEFDVYFLNHVQPL